MERNWYVVAGINQILNQDVASLTTYAMSRYLVTVHRIKRVDT